MLANTLNFKAFTSMNTLLDAHSWPMQPGVLQDVVGVSPDVQGGRLGVRLLRSVLTLGAIHLLRFGFAIGTAQVCIQHNPRNLE